MVIGIYKKLHNDECLIFIFTGEAIIPHVESKVL